MYCDKKKFKYVLFINVLQQHSRYANNFMVSIFMYTLPAIINQILLHVCKLSVQHKLCVFIMILFLKYMFYIHRVLKVLFSQNLTRNVI